MNNQEIGISLFSISGFMLFVALPVFSLFGILDWHAYAYTIVQPPNYYINFIWAFGILFFTGIRWGDARRWIALASVIMGSVIFLVAVYIAVFAIDIMREFNPF